MRYSKGLTTAAVFITVLILIGIMFSSTVQAKYITSDTIVERSTDELLDLEFFDEACDMYETSYFYENGFKFFNAGNTYVEIKNTTQGLVYDTNGWTGFSDNPYTVGDYTMDTPHDKRAIAMKCAEVDNKGELLSAGSVLGKSMNTMSKQYPTFVTLPDESYFYNITIKLADMVNLNQEDDSNYYMDMYIPSFTISFIAFNLDDVIWATENEYYDNLTTMGISVTFMRGTQQEITDIHNSSLNNYLFTYSEWELVSGVETESYTHTEELPHFSNDAWISMSMCFKKYGNIWYARYDINASSYKDPSLAVPMVFEQEIHIFNNENTLPVLNYFNNYYYHYEKDMEKEVWNWGYIIGGICFFVVGYVVFCLAFVFTLFTFGMSLCLIIAGGFLMGLGIYYMANSVTYNVPIEGIVEKMCLIFHEAKEFVQNLIDTVMMKPPPTRNMVNFIDELSIEYGNHVPEAHFSMYNQMNPNITDPRWYNRVKPIIPFDQVDFIDTNSVDYDGNYPLSTRFYTYFDDMPEFRYEYMNTSDPEISCFNTLGGFGSIRVDPQLHSTITVQENITIENITYEKVWKYSRVDVETRSITYDDLMGCSLSHETETKGESFAWGTITGAVFDTNGTLINGTLVDVDWPIITADMNNRDAKFIIGDPPLFFDASTTKYIIDMGIGASQRIMDNPALVLMHGLVFRWDLGDGTIASGLNVTHAYTREGIYSVTLTVTDKYGNTDDIKGTVTVYETQKFKYPPAGWFEQLPWWFWYALFGVIAAGSIGAVAMYYTGEGGGGFVQIIQPTTPTARPEYRERRQRQTKKRERGGGGGRKR